MGLISEWSKHPRTKRVWRQQAVLWAVLTVADAVNAATTHGIVLVFWAIFAVVFATMTVISIRGSQRVRPPCASSSHRGLG